MDEDKERVIQHLESSNKAFVSKRRRNMVVFFLRRVAAGIHFSAVVPSLWLYLKTFGSGTLWYGLVVAANPFIAMIVAPFLGRLYDKTKRSKLIITGMNICELIGALVYSLRLSPWLPLIGRIISGIGSAGSGVINGEVAMTTQSKARVSSYAIIEMGKMVGMLSGPPLALLFKNVDFKIATLQVDFTNAPGLLGFVLWTAIEVCNRVLTSNLALDYVMATLAKEDTVGDAQTISSVDETDAGQSEDTTLEQTDTEELVVNGPSVHPQGTGVTVWYLLRVVCRSEILSIISSYLVTQTTIVSMDVIIPLISQDTLGWGTVETSVAFLVAAGILVIVYGLLHKFGQKASEIWYLCISIVLIIMGQTFLLPITEISASIYVKASMFVAAVSFGCMSLPFCQVSTSSMLSKVVSIELQGYIQSIRGLVFNLAAVIGPIYGSFAFEHMYLGYGYLILMGIVTGLWFLVSLDVLKMRMGYKEDEESSKRSQPGQD